MEDIVVATSNKEAGIAVFNINTGISSCTDFKNSLSDTACLCTIGGDSSYSGLGLSTDYIVVAQSKKPAINVYHWGKPQAHMVCHVQEITTSMASDPSGTFILAGTKGGRIYIWEVCSGNLLCSWQAHFKTITRMKVSPCGMYIISVSEDGMSRVWEMTNIIRIPEVGVPNRTILPFRSYSPHTLPIRDLVILGSSSSLFRIVTISLDRSVVMYDVYSNKQIFSIFLPYSLDSIISNITQDFLFIGSTIGVIYILNMNTISASLSTSLSRIISIALTSSVSHTTTTNNLSSLMNTDNIKNTSNSTSSLPDGINILEGHTRSVTCLATSMNNNIIVSGSEDGTCRVWDIWTRQCLNEIIPLNRNPITCVQIMHHTMTASARVQRPSLAPFGHLKKYTTDLKFEIGPTLIGNNNGHSNKSSNLKYGLNSNPDFNIYKNSIYMNNLSNYNLQHSKDVLHSDENMDMEMDMDNESILPSKLIHNNSNLFDSYEMINLPNYDLNTSKQSSIMDIGTGIGRKRRRVIANDKDENIMEAIFPKKEIINETPTTVTSINNNNVSVIKPNAISTINDNKTISKRPIRQRKALRQ